MFKTKINLTNKNWAGVLLIYLRWKRLKTQPKSLIIFYAQTPPSHALYTSKLFKPFSREPLCSNLFYYDNNSVQIVQIEKTCSININIIEVKNYSSGQRKNKWYSFHAIVKGDMFWQRTHAACLITYDWKEI